MIWYEVLLLQNREHVFWVNYSNLIVDDGELWKFHKLGEPFWFWKYIDYIRCPDVVKRKIHENPTKWLRDIQGKPAMTTAAHIPRVWTWESVLLAVPCGLIFACCLCERCLQVLRLALSELKTGDEGHALNDSDPASSDSGTDTSELWHSFLESNLWHQQNWTGMKSVGKCEGKLGSCLRSQCCRWCLLHGPVASVDHQHGSTFRTFPSSYVRRWSSTRSSGSWESSGGQRCSLSMPLGCWNTWTGSQMAHFQCKLTCASQVSQTHGQRHLTSLGAGFGPPSSACFTSLV